MANFTEKKLVNEVQRIKNETEGNYGLNKFLLKKDQVRKEILTELEKGEKYYGFDPKYNSFEEYLSDSKNGEEGKKDNGNGKKLKEEFEARVDSYYNAFAIVVTEWFYNWMSEIENEKKTNWEKELNKVWKSFEEVRSFNGNKKTQSVYGAKDVDGDKTKNVKSWAKSEDDGTTAKDYGLTWNDAITQMKKWGEMSIPGFDLPAAKDILKKSINEVLNKNFSGQELKDFTENVNIFGHNKSQWDKDDGLEATIDNKVENETDIQNYTDQMNEAIGTCFIDWYAEKAKATTDLEEKKEYLTKIEQFFKENTSDPFHWAITATDNVKKIKKLREEVGAKTKKTPILGGWKAVGLCQSYYGNDPDEWKKVGLCQKYYG